MRPSRSFRIAGRVLAVAVLLCGVVGPAKADILYAATGSGGVNGELFILNPATGAVIQDVGPLVDAAGHHYGLTGLAFQPGTNVLFGSTGNQSPTAPAHLVIVNPSTGRVTDVGAYNAGPQITMSDITFNPLTGRLFGNSGLSGNFFVINTATGAATPVGSTGVGVTFGGGLAANAAGTIFGSPQGVPGGLFTYNQTTGAATFAATLSGIPGGFGNINAMSFDSTGTLLGSALTANGFHLIAINPVTGAITDRGLIPSNIDAIAIQTPEPSSIAVFAVVLLGLIPLWLRYGMA
jgi:hypothetical protein